jgi:hypothetical protein
MTLRRPFAAASHLLALAALSAAWAQPTPPGQPACSQPDDLSSQEAKCKPVDIAQWLPDGAIYTLHVTEPDALLNLANSLRLFPLLGIPTDKGLQLLLDILAKRAGTDWQGLARNVTAGGITFAMYPGDSSVWIFDARDATVLDPLQLFVKTIAGAAHLAAPASAKSPVAFYQEYPGNTAAWSLDGKQFFARTGNRLVLANRGDVLKALFTPHPGALASSPLYLQAKNAISPEKPSASHEVSGAWAYVNMAALNQYPPIQKGLAFNSEPFDALLNGAWKQSLRDSRWLAGSLSLDGKKLRLHFVTDGKLPPTLAGAFTLPGPSGILPELTVPRQLAAATLWRDLGKFYAEKDTLFPLKTSGGILAENFLEIFFTGRNLADDVLARFRPQVRLVVARQQYDPAMGTPDEQFPAAALVFRTDPESAADFGDVMEEAWQKAVGLTNFTRGQNAQQGLILDRQTHAGVTFTYGAFSPRAEKDRAHLPARFNTRPAIVHCGPYIILSSTDALARDLIDAVNKEDGRTPAVPSSAHTIIEVDNVPEIAALLQADKPAIVRNSVLANGKKPAQAAPDFDQNVSWLDKIAEVKLSVYSDQLDLDLELR